MIYDIVLCHRWERIFQSGEKCSDGVGASCSDHQFWLIRAKKMHDLVCKIWDVREGSIRKSLVVV